MLHKGKNSGIGNEPIEVKIPILKTSEINATSQLGASIELNDNKWSENEIRECYNIRNL